MLEYTGLYKRSVNLGNLKIKLGVGMGLEINQEPENR